MSMISTYSLTIDWALLDSELEEKLDNSNSSKSRADLKSILALRKFIFRTLCPSYKLFQSNHPECKKYPGRAVYRDLSTQVLRRYGHAFQTTVRGKVVDNGHEWFALKLEESVLNKMKGTNRRPCQSSGDDEDEWDAEAMEREEQEETKRQLQDACQSDWEDVQCQMADSFELRKEDIKKLKTASGWPKNIKEEWPWLCCAEGINQHSNVLLGHDLELAYARFKEEELDDFLNFAVSSTSCNIQNMSARLSSDPDDDLAMILIVGNIFKEDIKKLILSVSDDESDESSDEESNLPAYPCIINQGSTKFKVSIHKHLLITTDSCADALIALLSCCHSLNLEYPPFPLSMEFLERYVFELPLPRTKIFKKGLQVQSMSTAVMKTISKIDEFKGKLRAALNQD